MSESNAKLIASLAAAHAAIGAPLIALTESPPAPDVPVPAPASGGGDCQHTHRTKQPLSFGLSEHWVCDDCGYEYRR